MTLQLHQQQHHGWGPMRPAVVIPAMARQGEAWGLQAQQAQAAALVGHTWLPLLLQAAAGQAGSAAARQTGTTGCATLSTCLC